MFVYNTCREDSKLPQVSEDEGLNASNDEIHREVAPEIQLSSTLHEGDYRTFQAEVPKGKVDEIIQEEEADYYTTPVQATDMSNAVLVTGYLPLPPCMTTTTDSVTCPSAPLLSGNKGSSSKNTGSVVYNFLSDEVVESALETSRYQWTPQNDGATPGTVLGKRKRSSQVKVSKPKKSKVIKQQAESSNGNQGKPVFITNTTVTRNKLPDRCDLVFQRPGQSVAEGDIEKEVYTVGRQCVEEVQREKGKRSEGRQCMGWRRFPSLVQATPSDRSDATPPLEGPPDT